MRFGVLGTGTVGRTIAAKLEQLGHEVRVGSREAGEDKVPFADAAAFGEVVVNATAGDGQRSPRSSRPGRTTWPASC